jgi:hypothetical protein
MRERIPLGRNFGKGRSNAAGMSSLANMYGEEVKGDERTDWVLYGTPGEALFSTIGGTPRGQIRAAEVNYAVMGTRFYKVNADGTTVDLGEIEGTAAVDMSYNGAQIDIVAELKSYSYDVPGLSLTEISDPNFQQASSCDSVASYSIYARKGTGQFAYRLVNSASFSALDAATAEAESDNLVAVRKTGNEIALLGVTSIEWWYPTGLSTPGDSFARTSTAAASIGCISRDTAIVFDSGLTWAGNDGKAGGRGVYRAEGYTPRKISTPQVDAYLEAATTPANLRALSYQSRGHLFYVLTNPGEWSLYWDISTNQWGYRKSGSWSMGSDPLGGWDAATFAVNGSKQVIGKSDGNLWELLPDTYTELGSEITREVTSPQTHKGGKRVYCASVELDVQAGIGLVSGQGSQPVAFECHSDDGGQTWTTPRSATLGPMGQNKYRARWFAMGSFRQRMYKFRCTDPVKFVIVGAWHDINVGSV